MNHSSQAEIDVDKILAEVSREVARRRFARGLPAAPQSAPMTWAMGFQDAVSPPAKLDYHVKYLLLFHDEAFIHAAYQAVLNRPADELGFNLCLAHLRAGGGKHDILRNLAFSAEGQAAATTIAGLQSAPVNTGEDASADHAYQYHLKDLRLFHDEAFIHAAYQAVLRRDADPVGLSHHLQLLRSGIGKQEILESMCNSAEGQAIGATIAGLRGQVH